MKNLRLLLLSILFVAFSQSAFAYVTNTQIIVQSTTVSMKKDKEGTPKPVSRKKVLGIKQERDNSKNHKRETPQ